MLFNAVASGSVSRSNKIYLFLLVYSKRIVFCFTVSGLPKRTGEREWGSALVNPENNDLTCFWTKTEANLTRRSKIPTKSTEAKVKGRKIQKLRKSLLSPLILNKYYVGFKLCYVTVSFTVNQPR